mgnify:CR=1 FL=1
MKKLLITIVLCMPVMLIASVRPIHIQSAAGDVVCQLPSRSRLSRAIAAAKADADVFAVPLSVDFTPYNSGMWSTVDDERVWRIVLCSEDACSLNLLVSDFFIPCRAVLTVASADGCSYIFRFTADNNSSLLAVPAIAGDSIIVEYTEPCDAPFAGMFTISQVGHGFKQVPVLGGSEQSGYCQVSVNSDIADEWLSDAHAVCKIIIGGTTLCTGTLLATADAANPNYVLTARHCISTARQAQGSVFIFNYGDLTSVDSCYVSGSELVAVKNRDSDGYLDFALVRLEALPIGGAISRAGWNATEKQPVGAVCIHHPNGDLKKIAITSDSLMVTSYNNFDPATFFNVGEWSVGATEAGSSGAPLFDDDHKVVGLLAGGDSDCDYPMNDYFQMFAACYNRYSVDSQQLAHWLDPLSITSGTLSSDPVSRINDQSVPQPAVVSVMPSPAVTRITIVADRPIGNIIVTDAYGRLLRSAVVDGECSFIVDVSNYADGIYIAQVQLTDGQKYAVKFIVNKQK